MLRPSRQSMTHERKAALVQLAFEKSLTRTIDLDEFVAVCMEFTSNSSVAVLHCVGLVIFVPKCNF